MNNKQKRFLYGLAIASVLSICGMSDVRAQQRPPAPLPSVQRTLSGVIRWQKEMGVLPSAPGSTAPGTDICSPFYVAVTDLYSRPEEMVAHDNKLSVQSVVDPQYHVCRFEMHVPSNRNLRVMAGMGNVLSLPKPERQLFHYAEPWIAEGGARPAPYRRSIRTFAPNRRDVMLGAKGMYLRFELTYGRNDFGGVDPK